jgi:hypothetical protein
LRVWVEEQGFGIIVHLDPPVLGIPDAGLTGEVWFVRIVQDLLGLVIGCQTVDDDMLVV